MALIRLVLLCLLFFPGIDTCHAGDDSSALLSPLPTADKTITPLFTNDVESAYDPMPAFWLDDISMGYDAMVIGNHEFEYGYDSFPESNVIGNVGKVSDVITQYFENREVVAVP
jgi:hypothetical protein